MKRFLTIFITLCSMMLAAPCAGAFDLSTYAEKSVLAEGRWVKVSVKTDGLYLLKAEDLRKWGFTDMSRVRVYGYGGRRISDYLTRDNYIDDLPMVQTVNTSAGVYFYGVGVTAWTTYNGVDFRPQNNPFSYAGYYYITENDEPLREISNSGTASAQGTPSTTFREHIFHEQDLISLAETGHMLLGEDFKTTRTHKFTFSLPDKADGTQVWLEADMVVKSVGFTTYLSFIANDTSLPYEDTDVISSTSNNTHYHGQEKMIRKTFDMTGETLNLQLTLNATSTVSNANLNYISVNYYRNLRLSGNSMQFETNSLSHTLSGTSDNTVLWDVTDPLNITAINALKESGKMTWTSSFGNVRTYMAWNEGTNLPSPEYVASVANQNIHGMETPDMVIFCVPEFAYQAEKLAKFHRESEDSLNVIVLSQDDVFNEFSSGTADVNSLRKCLKMFYDRGKVFGNYLRYALMFGKATHDNRHATEAVRAQGVTTMPTWESESGLNDNDSFTTDDIFAFLEDNSGLSLGTDKVQIGIGRLSVTSSSEATTVVNKIIKYVTSSPDGNWQNNALLVADDEDKGIHMQQTDAMWNKMKSSNGGNDMFYQKIYIDAYERSGGTYPGARSDMFRILEEGVAWWSFVGHANPASWTADGLMTYTDIASLYLKKLPVVFAFTCDFQRWDGKDASAAEILFKNANGGVAAAFSATRPVYISENGNFSLIIGSYIFSKDEKGKRLTLGDAIRLSKANYNIGGRPVSNTNKLRYVLLGDPAMRFVTPSPRIVVKEINGEPIDGDIPPTMMASQRATVKGELLNCDGTVMKGYNGIITSTLYDAETSFTTLGNGENGVQETYDQQGTRLYAGSDSIIDGQFTLNIAMPSEIADNYRPAALNLFASSSTDKRKAVGLNTDFYVFGFDDSAPDDKEPPVIEYFYLNHSSFSDGDKVNESPMAIAKVSDNVAINLSMAGIGHQMTMWLDGAEKSYNDVSQFYTPSADGSASGTIAYQLENLTDGAHSLRLRVWDTSANPAEQTLTFFVENGLPIRAFDVYADANPASAETNFYITHNRPDAMVEVTIEVYDIMGRLTWTSVQSGRCDLFTTFPITWNLCDMSGRRVPRGIYIYRASMKSEDGTVSNSIAKKIAVTAR